VGKSKKRKGGSKKVALLRYAIGQKQCPLKGKQKREGEGKKGLEQKKRACFTSGGAFQGVIALKLLLNKLEKKTRGQNLKGKRGRKRELSTG